MLNYINWIVIKEKWAIPQMNFTYIYRKSNWKEYCSDLFADLLLKCIWAYLLHNNSITLDYIREYRELIKVLEIFWVQRISSYYKRRILNIKDYKSLKCYIESWDYEKDLNFIHY